MWQNFWMPIWNLLAAFVIVCSWGRPAYSEGQPLPAPSRVVVYPKAQDPMRSHVSVLGETAPQPQVSGVAPQPTAGSPEAMSSGQPSAPVVGADGAVNTGSASSSPASGATENSREYSVRKHIELVREAMAPYAHFPLVEPVLNRLLQPKPFSILVELLPKMKEQNTLIKLGILQLLGWIGAMMVTAILVSQAQSTAAKFVMRLIGWVVWVAVTVLMPGFTLGSRYWDWLQSLIS